MEFESTNGMFTISLPDEVEADKQRRDANEKKNIETNLKCLKEDVSLWDLADTIFNDLFCSTELKLEGKTIECEVTNSRGESRFFFPLIVDFQDSMDDVLLCIAGQWLI